MVLLQVDVKGFPTGPTRPGTHDLDRGQLLSRGGCQLRFGAPLPVPLDRSTGAGAGAGVGAEAADASGAGAADSPALLPWVP
ncbi:hypothetical protein EIC84_03445 [Comamonas sp. A23]|nr:hypothetical protein EIC84_03445 [Comamonas sp. A23]